MTSLHLSNALVTRFEEKPSNQLPAAQWMTRRLGEPSVGQDERQLPDWIGDPMIK